MEFRPLNITVVSADDLKDVNLMSRMDVYVAVTVSGDPRTSQRTPVDKDAGISPRWNHRLSFQLSESAIGGSNLWLVFKIVSNRVLGDKEIGEVSVPVKELLDAAGNGGDADERVVEYKVHTVSGKTKGTLKFSYKFGEIAVPPPVAAAPPPFAAQGKSSGEPVTAYPPQHAAGYPPPYAQPYAPPPQMGYGYPPPQPGYGYPPAPGYGAPPPGYGQPGYSGYGVVPPKKKKQGMGGLGLGLGAGLLGGLLVGDMISDAGAYDAGYDAGFDDGGGFDF